MSKQFLCSIWKKRNERPNVGGVSIRSSNGAPSRKGCVVNGQITTASTNEYAPPPPPPDPHPYAAATTTVTTFYRKAEHWGEKQDGRHPHRERGCHPLYPPLPPPSPPCPRLLVPPRTTRYKRQHLSRNKNTHINSLTSTLEKWNPYRTRCPQASYTPTPHLKAEHQEIKQDGRHP